MTTSDDQVITVTDNPGEHRFEIHVGGALAGFTEYRPPTGDRYAFVHTEIGEEFGGRGLASRLIKGALDEMRARGIGRAAVLPVRQAVHPAARRLPGPGAGRRAGEVRDPGGLTAGVGAARPSAPPTHDHAEGVVLSAQRHTFCMINSGSGTRVRRQRNHRGMPRRTTVVASVRARSPQQGASHDQTRRPDGRSQRLAHDAPGQFGHPAQAGARDPAPGGLVRPAVPPGAGGLPVADGHLVGDRSDHPAAGRRRGQPDQRQRHRAGRSSPSRWSSAASPCWTRCCRWAPAGTPRGSARA